MCFAFKVAVYAYVVFHHGGENVVVGIYHHGPFMKFQGRLCVDRHCRTREQAGNQGYFHHIIVIKNQNLFKFSRGSPLNICKQSGSLKKKAGNWTSSAACFV